MVTPLPAARPSTLTTTGYPSPGGALAGGPSPRACSPPPLPTTSRRTALGPLSGLYPLDYRLVPLGTDADHTQGRPYLFFDEGDESARLLGQLLPPAAPRNVYAPAGERLLD